MIRVLLLFLLFFHTAFADEIRPAFLELTQKSENSYKVLWKKPGQGEASSALKIKVAFPSSAEVKGIKQISQTRSAILETYVIEDENALIGQTITIEGLETTSSDVLVRIVTLKHYTVT